MSVLVMGLMDNFGAQWFIDKFDDSMLGGVAGFQERIPARGRYSQNTDRSAGVP